MESERSTEEIGRATWLPGWWWRLSVAGRRGVVVAVAAVLLVAALWVLWSPDGEGGPGEVASEGEPPSGAARFVESLPSERLATWEQLAECESRGQWDLATGNGFFGGLQFTEESWHGVGGTGLPHHHPPAEQIMRAELLEDVQGFGAWPRCAEEVGLLGS